MEPDFVPADPRYRRKLFTVYAVVVFLLIALPWQLGPVLWAAFLKSAPREMLVIAEITAIVLLIGFIPPSLYLIHHGRRVVREGRFPHSGMKAIYDTPIRRGRKALTTGRILRNLGVACVACVLLGSGATHFIFYKFKTDPQFFLRQ